MLNLHRAEFIRSAVKQADFPDDGLPQVVFAGKSNVGKSSTINKLLNRRNFARVGGQPGKTIHINFFNLDEKMYWVDLPGYGYAKVSKQERARWGALLQEYFEVGQLSLGILIVDIRHKPTADDKLMVDWFLETGMPLVIVANKLDKIKKRECEESVRLIRQTLLLPEHVDVVPFSAEKGDGREEILARIQSLVL